MKRFARLFAQIDASTRTSEKVRALVEYFRDAPEVDAAWAVWVLAGSKAGKSVNGRVLREEVAAVTGLPAWLIEESYEHVGDLSETVSLLVPGGLSSDGNGEERRAGNGPELSLADAFERLVVPLWSAADESRVRALLREAWGMVPRDELFVFQKLISGNFRVGVQRTLLVRALSELTGLDSTLLTQRLMAMGAKRAGLPTVAVWRALVAAAGSDEAGGTRPVPFCLAQQIEEPWETFELLLGPADRYLAEWKWDGIRAQLVVRGGSAELWSRGEEPVSRQFPEVMGLAGALGHVAGDVVLDGEVLLWDSRGPRPFGELQTRLNRKSAPAVGLFDSVMGLGRVVFVAFDVMESGGRDLRGEPLGTRRVELERIVAAVSARDDTLRLSERVVGATWEELAAQRATLGHDRTAEGLMLKHLDGAYVAGRGRDALGRSWMKWKVEPATVDCVLVAAQPGHGKRAGLFTDYTFAVWDGDALVTFAKAYSGLTDEEIAKVDRFVRQNTVGRAGPVRMVKPELVFELAFQEIQPSDRHKSGVAVRFPRIKRWRLDKAAREADRIETLRELVKLRHGGA